MLRVVAVAVRDIRPKGGGLRQRAEQSIHSGLACNRGKAVRAGPLLEVITRPDVADHLAVVVAPRGVDDS